jgi:hypothetical protein
LISFMSEAGSPDHSIRFRTLHDFVIDGSPKEHVCEHSMHPRWRPLSIRLAALAVVLAAACAPPTAPADDAPLKAPFTVSDHFTPTGYIGDGVTIGVVNMLPDACPTRAPNAVGDCYQVTYIPPVPTQNDYAGVFWQYPGNNWGDYPGHTVLPGATKVTVWARGGKGGEQLTFQAGGVSVTDSSKPYHDSFSAAAGPFTLTTEWQPFVVPLTGKTYNRVLGGFAWIYHLPPATGAPSDSEPIVFYLDSITWSP